MTTVSMSAWYSVRVRSSAQQSPRLTAGVAVGFQPLFIPIRVLLTSNGDVQVQGAAKLPTPIGVFDLEVTPILDGDGQPIAPIMFTAPPRDKAA